MGRKFLEKHTSTDLTSSIQHRSEAKKISFEKIKIKSERI